MFLLIIDFLYAIDSKNILLKIPVIFIIKVTKGFYIKSLIRQYFTVSLQ